MSQTNLFVAVSNVGVSTIQTAFNAYIFGITNPKAAALYTLASSIAEYVTDFFVPYEDSDLDANFNLLLFESAVCIGTLFASKKIVNRLGYADFTWGALVKLITLSYAELLVIKSIVYSTKEITSNVKLP